MFVKHLIVTFTKHDINKYYELLLSIQEKKHPSRKECLTFWYFLFVKRAVTSEGVYTSERMIYS